MSDILSFPRPALVDKPAISVVEKDYRECGHARFKIDHELPLVMCADCGAVMEPHNVLRKIARSMHQRDYHIAELKRRSEDFAKQIERQMALRKKRQLAESDARELHRLRATIEAHATDFPGAIEITEPPND